MTTGLTPHCPLCEECPLLAGLDVSWMQRLKRRLVPVSYCLHTCPRPIPKSLMGHRPRCLLREISDISSYSPQTHEVSSGYIRRVNPTKPLCKHSRLLLPSRTYPGVQKLDVDPQVHYNAHAQPFGNHLRSPARKRDVIPQEHSPRR